MVRLSRFFRQHLPSNLQSNYYLRKGGWVHRHYRNTPFGMFLIEPYYRNGSLVRRRNRNISLSQVRGRTRPMSLDEFFHSRGIAIIRRRNPENLDVFLNTRPAPPM